MMAIQLNANSFALYNKNSAFQEILVTLMLAIIMNKSSKNCLTIAFFFQIAKKSPQVAHICVSDWFIWCFKPFLKQYHFAFSFYEPN